MNLLVLLIGLRVWAASPVEAFARTTGAIACLSLEMQVGTLSGAGSLQALPIVNAVVALALYLASAPRAPTHNVERGAARARAVLPWPAILLLAALAIVLAVARPLEGADPYHLERVAQIARLGT